MDVVLILLGVALLYVGGELLVRNATLLAATWGLSPMVVGLTIVALGTSAPELAASLVAALRDSPEMALGNVIGSNAANVGLILAITALVHPLRTRARFLRREVPIMVGASALLLLVVPGDYIGRIEGAVFILLLVAYLLFLLSEGETPEVEEEFRREYSAKDLRPPWLAVAGVVFGLALLVAGAHTLVTGATALARGFGVPELIIGITLVALGTSLPELATSLVAALKREPEIALGNIVGSNIFNVLGIVGVTALVRPISVPFGAVAVDLLVMLGLCVLLLPFLLTGLRLGRREASVFLLLYVVYVGYLYAR